MGKIIRDNQLDIYSRNDDIIGFNKKKKTKKFKDPDKQNKKLVKKE